MRKVRHIFDPPKVNGVACDPVEGKTKQEFKDECDINVLMRRYLSSGNFPVGLPLGRYGDFSNVGDFQDAQQVIKTATEQFAGLPSKIRDRFKNNPAEFLAWVGKVENLDEAHSLGLLSEEAAARFVASKAAAPKPEGENKK